MFEKCLCGSGELYSKCCKPYIKGKEAAPTPEALMRSRYAAYVLHEIDYIMDTCLKKDTINRDGVTDWSEKSNWLGLNIISSTASDDAGTVVFEAVYERKGLKYVHHETATFYKKDDKWFYASGVLEQRQIVRIGEKVGRNDPCPCRSGKKYKHCCGR